MPVTLRPSSIVHLLLKLIKVFEEISKFSHILKHLYLLVTFREINFRRDWFSCEFIFIDTNSVMFCMDLFSRIGNFNYFVWTYFGGCRYFFFLIKL